MVGPETGHSIDPEDTVARSPSLGRCVQIGGWLIHLEPFGLSLHNHVYSLAAPLPDGETGAVGEVQVPEVPAVEAGLAGTVATTVPAPLIPTTVAPAVAEAPGAASTTMLSVGAEASSSTPFDNKRTESTPVPTQTATQATGEPSTPPNVPSPRTVRPRGADDELVGRRT